MGEPKNGWIDVKDRLPADDARFYCLVWGKYGPKDELQAYNALWLEGQFTVPQISIILDFHEVTHWQPYPGSPH